jgi:hypothetical protein
LPSLREEVPDELPGVDAGERTIRMNREAPNLSTGDAGVQTGTRIEWMPDMRTALARARAEDKPLYLDFYHPG